MQAQRKAVDPVATRAGAAPDAEGWAPSGDAATLSDRSSPAHLMLRDLASRLTDAELAAAAEAGPAGPKWPMPVRLGVIVGLGLACWAVAGVVIALAL